MSVHANRPAILAAALAALSLLAGACDRDAAEAPSDGPSVVSTDVEVDRSKEIEANVEVTATGAAAFHWSGRERFEIMRVGAKGLQVNILGTGFKEPVPLPEDPRNRFRWAFDLHGLYDDEPATFTMEAPAADSQTAGHYVVLVWLRVKDGSKPAVFEMSEVDEFEEFTELRRPCTLEVGPDVLSGRLACPELASASGKTAALDVRWSDGVVVASEDAPPADAGSPQEEAS